jgi:hypothetical protein
LSKVSEVAVEVFASKRTNSQSRIQLMTINQIL